MSDPKLKEAMAEVKGILKKHDIAACVTLVSETHCEFFYEFEPSWSVAHLQSDGGIRFRSKRADFKSKKQQDHCTSCTVHMFNSILEINGKSFLDMDKLMEMLSEHIDIEFTPAEFEPHRPQ